MTVDVAYNKFICDTCGKFEFTKSHPKGWKWLKPVKSEDILKVEHACEECLQEIPKIRHGTWGQRN